jgi:peptide/nickel transport system substrate-binding protein
MMGRLITRTIAVLVAVASVLLLGTAFAQTKTIRVALTGPITTLDPANHRSRLSENVIRNIFDGLYTVRTDGALIPEIAEGVRQVDDTTWEFTIRQGITFHNGDPLTASDVVFSFNRVVVEGAMEGETSPRKGLMGSLQEVTQVDDYTVRFHLGAPESEMRVLTSSVFMQIMPRDYFEEVGVEAFIQNPVGAGPFRFVEADYSSRIVLERFDDYWGGAPDLAGSAGPAPADRIVFEVVPDPTSRLAALRAGDLDVIQGLLADQVPVVESDPNVVLKLAPGTNPVFLAFTTTRPPFDDPHVRRAIAHAIDYDLLVAQIFAGLADPLYGMPTIWNSEVQHPELEPYTFDPERARAMLAEAGVEGLELTIDAIGTWQLVAEAVAQLLQDVGINAQVRVWELGALQQATQAGERQAMIHTWGNASGNPSWPVFPNDPAVGYTLWTESQEFWDIMGVAPGIVDVAEREAAFRRAYDIHHEALPLITILLPQTLEAARANVLNFEAHPGGRVNMHRVDLATP